ncbi:MAG: Fe-S protein assembly chaperone HscA [Hydrogenophilales bacterium CG03_land_8_20_14_0_80_62_28]|nr:Fe-S protein assembly chaperone HscA [Betaproteobacteria bacterium]OIO79899.1 MAG: Fe-S protein assembly chaperone HscA [Hydrogenophilaceae bacterium CG1_02_62_390]PIV23381.1 MAG: Fe-S protein assembly chaperone HscA [Hydrogenophilales bacterium CG03_land_8_20_14_0_80_62_28]PIW37806.1 MAG: Fe-S protein assembly chaperone HscA [Hydrogenophilales bacterium CG15_BIG_FIL_POST_REV_8_21_14_020_62_31]PIW72614.1 MAG: Fe-S protein assembly chaperone HscA [Hydrogenophilales bacterium CG12_big_fil_rev_
MALLQISEPGLSTAPHEHRLAAGIDLGTTNSLVATVRNGISVVLNDERGRPLLPSVVRYLNDGVTVVGYDAQARQSDDPHNTIVSVKRFMGRGLKDLVDLSTLPYHFVDAPGMVQLKTVVGAKTPVEVSAEILKALKMRAETALGGELTGAVITVPAYFDDAQRQATKDAARLAGLNVLRLLNEPTAAAIAYGLDNSSEGIYAVYDLGGGTFDISVLKLTKGVFEVLATNGDSALGGDDFDRRVYCWMLEQSGLSVLSDHDKSLLMAKAREAKEALTEHAEARITAVLTTGELIDLTLTEGQFNELTASLVGKTLTPTRKALRDAGLSAADVKGVVMVGGSTRIPRIQAAVGEFFGQTPLTNLDPDKVVALGAAIQANVLAGNKREDDWLLLDVAPLSLGLETMGGLVEKIIPRNSTIPIARAQDFTTYKDGQTAMSIHVLQGERERVSDCRSLARFELRGIPPMVAGAARIRVTFQVDADGLLSVSARETATGVEAHIEVKPSYGLTDDEIARMLRESIDHAMDDVDARQLAELRVDAQRLVDATQSALAENGAALLSQSERTAIDALLGQMNAALTTSDPSAIKRATEALNQGTTEFAARRMDVGIKRALAGHKIEDIGI